jgi:hypothetical protein
MSGPAVPEHATELTAAGQGTEHEKTS